MGESKTSTKNSMCCADMQTNLWAEQELLTAEEMQTIREKLSDQGPRGSAGVSEEHST